MIIHVGEPGDNLYTLHERYGVSMADLLRVNDLPNPEQLVVGLALLIPVKGTWHTVRAGESLWSIANDYGMSLNLVLEANPGIDAETLMPGQEIFIPLLRHEVAPGETLASIANQYGVSVYALAQENALTITEPIFTGQTLFIPREKPIIDVNAYSYQQDAAGAQSIREVGELLTIVSPFAYLIQADGSLEPFPDEQMIAASYEENILPMMSILNFTSEEAGSTLTHTILTSDELMDTLLTNILRVMNEKGYRGLNIDFENVLPEDRERFNNFIQLAVDRLHPEGYFVSTAVAPKTSADQPGLLYEAHDYAAQGRIADFVVVMTYEWGYRLGPPQAISPLNQMRRVIKYALTEIPAEKIFLGFQIYARDWKLPHVQGQAAQTFSPQRAVELATEYNAEIQYDEVAASPFFRYTDEDGVDHEVWFEDARSAQAKFDLAKEFNLGGISYWALGYPFPQNWELLRDNFTVRKRI
ncbi:LysM peptidoglycan-binding domain-containing protein [Oceanobacillus alkalisoli]|uniref:LysM peptidoglycan-binding domain-containing protein n=1 Tax=Oceanobacillus alkalisoli TaxID=2925113 RepID=UPI001F11F56C|nr:LysM peptidoglycan-binding domain-containing protein [Oceanobacillus alkalisoli]MCF3943588.1 LysM peptidoglycan-binding domain-containing protein [Oceanobacillus alkalisoli]